MICNEGRYGAIPVAAQQLIRVVKLKQLGKKLGFSRIKPEGTQHIVMETPMEEPGWNLLKANLPDPSPFSLCLYPRKSHRSRFSHPQRRPATRKLDQLARSNAGSNSRGDRGVD